MRSLSIILILFIAAHASAKTYSQVQSIFNQRCLSCHDQKEAEGGLILESHALALKGGDSGPAIIPGKSAESPIIQQLQHTKKPFMPPPKKAPKLSDAEIAIIRAWIDAGAPNLQPGETLPTTRPAIPKILPKTPPPNSIYSAAYAPQSKTLALSRNDQIELTSPETRGLLRRINPEIGRINDLAFSNDGTLLAAAGGKPATLGQAKIFNPSSGDLIKKFDGHKDAIYAVAISPDKKILATGSYDQKIILWNIADGAKLRDLEGHNGAVTDLSFRPDGKILASCSADRTVKLWNVADGKRLDTFSESLKDLNAVSFSPDGKKLAAAGVDNRIRIWLISDKATEGSNSLLFATFAHEGAILRLAWSADGKTILSSADDKTVKVWNAETMTPKIALPTQGDWPTALALVSDDKAAAIGRLDGTLSYYDIATGKIIPPPKPEVTALEPRYLQRGQTIKVKVIGKNLATATNLKTSDSRLAGKLLTEDAGHADYLLAEITAPADLPPNSYDISIASTAGPSTAAKLHVDTLPQVAETEPNDTPASAPTIPINNGISLWGKFDKRGDSDCFAFEAQSGQTLVFDIAAQRLASKSDVVLTLFDSSGNVLASANQFDNSPDPLLAHTFTSPGRYVIRATDLLANSSPDHFYRLSIGPFPYVTAAFPMAIQANMQSNIQLAGFNLPPNITIPLKPTMAGEIDVPLDPITYRTRRAIKVMVSATPEPVEIEPNDTPATATPITVPANINARIFATTRPSEPDIDLYRFQAQKGKQYIIETLASRRGSPIDTKIEILHPDGRPVERVILKATRDSYITFRGFDANQAGARLQNWEEMELNQYLYLQGEVVKLFLAPRGPDSEYNFYQSAGKRRCYFDTSATAHALDEHAYIVEALPPGSKFPPTGLPVITLNYSNDDDGLRQLGSDSRIHFTAPSDGPFLIRVTDVRGFGGDRFTYRLSLREAKPDFNVVLENVNANVPSGSARQFTVRADRIDGFEGEIKVNITDIPPGFVISTPLTIEAGHTSALGTLYASPTAMNQPTTSKTKLIATAMIDGKPITKPVNDFPRLTRATGAPGLLVALEPMAENVLANKGHPGPTTQPFISASKENIYSSTRPTTRPTTQPFEPFELTIAPGAMIPAMLKINRNGLAGPVTFDVDNLPHGIIVADIGLNGVLIPDGQSERQIFLQCAPNVPDQDRLCHAKAREAGNPTSLPLLLHVRKK